MLVADWSTSAAPPAVAAAAGAGSRRHRRSRSSPTRGPAGTTATSLGCKPALNPGGGGGGAGGAVQINGPLAVATSRVAESSRRATAWSYPPAPWYYPFVTTSFDRGRSRHQTLRMLLQDQFQIDRDGPYAYDRWDEPGLGPALAPVPHRGLAVSASSSTAA